MNEPAFVKIQLRIFGWIHSLFVKYVVGTGPYVKIKLCVTVKFFHSRNMRPKRIGAYAVMGTVIFPVTHYCAILVHYCAILVHLVACKCRVIYGFICLCTHDFLRHYLLLSSSKLIG